MVGILALCVILILAAGPRSSESTPHSAQAFHAEPSMQTHASVPTPKAKPPDPAAQKAAKKILREKYAQETQNDLWRQGMEMTFQAHGTTLYVRYVLAGDAFAFQFHERFLHDNTETLTALGFKNVELSNDETVWRWKLSN
jgi:hypothetical protein